MRPKILLTLLAVAVAIFGGMLLVKHATSSRTSVANPPAPATAPAVVSTPTTASPTASAPVVTAPAPVPETPEQHQAAIDAEVNRLTELSYKRDDASLAIILADLTSPEKDIRDAAITAAGQSENTNAIPVLKADAASSTDPDEQIAMLKAAQFLALPDAPLQSSGPQIPATPEQIQAAQQKFDAIQAQRQATAASHNGPNQNPSPATPPAAP